MSEREALAAVKYENLAADLRWLLDNPDENDAGLTLACANALDEAQAKIFRLRSSLEVAKEALRKIEAVKYEDADLCQWQDIAREALAKIEEGK
jgi:hypothetical protein